MEILQPPPQNLGGSRLPQLPRIDAYEYNVHFFSAIVIVAKHARVIYYTLAGVVLCSSGDVRAKFRQYDLKKRGYITADEAFPVLERELGFDQSKAEALVDKYDKNRDYRLSLLEFVEFQKKVEEL